MTPGYDQLAARDRDQADAARAAAAELRDDDGRRGDLAAEARDDAGVLRDAAGVRRDRAAAERDARSARRDQDGADRDRAAELRDLISANHASGTGSEWAARVALARREAAADRAWARKDRDAGVHLRSRAGLDRRRALRDRAVGAHDRSDAGRDRRGALIDRAASATDRHHASTDSLTGVYSRGAGLVELRRDVARAQRENQPAVLAFLDVDHLKRVNDTGGHAAGDRLLRDVATTLVSDLRPYDLVVRYGGDEFLCLFPAMSIHAAEARLTLINVRLAAKHEDASVTGGFTDLRSTDSLDAMIARADAALYARRRTRSPLPPP